MRRTLTKTWRGRLISLTLIGLSLSLQACGTRTQTVVQRPPEWMLEPCQEPEVLPELSQAKTLRQYSEAMTHREIDWQETLAICNGKFHTLKHWYNSQEK